MQYGGSGGVHVMPSVVLVLLRARGISCVVATLLSMSASVLQPIAAGSPIAPRQMAAQLFTSISENLANCLWRDINLIAHFLHGLLTAPYEAK